MLTSSLTFTSLTNIQFLLAESSLVAQALLDGASWPELRRAAQEARLFGPGKASSQLTILGGLKKRFADISPDHLSTVASGTLETRRILVLAMITAQKPLLRAFIADVLLYKWQRLDKQLTDADARAFLMEQTEQHQDLASWSSAIDQKTRGNLTRFLVDGGLLKERRQGEFDILP